MFDLKATLAVTPNDCCHANAGFSQLWQILPNAVYDDSRKTLGVPTGFHMLSRGDTILARKCHEQLTELALTMSPTQPIASMVTCTHLLYHSCWENAPSTCLPACLLEEWCLLHGP